MEAFSDACLALALLGLLWFGLQIMAVRSFMDEKDRPHRRDPFLPPVSILKPLKGLDDNLFDNLESFCNQDYPDYEIVFCVDDENDPAFRVARKVRDRHRHHRIAIAITQDQHGSNPKVNNLIGAYKLARAPYVLMSDSNVMVERAYVKEMVKHMADPAVGLVSSLMRGQGGRTLGAILENLYVNSFVLRDVCTKLRVFRIPAVLGKSMLIRKGDLDEMGGFHAVKDILAEDHKIATWMREKGKRVVVSSHVIDSVSEYDSLRRFLKRSVRWGRMRWQIGPGRYVIEILSNSVFTSCLPLMLGVPTRSNVSFALAVAFLRALGEYYLGRKVGASQGMFAYTLAPFKDILMAVLWFLPLFGETIAWRGTRFRLGKGLALFPSLPVTSES